MPQPRSKSFITRAADRAGLEYGLDPADYEPAFMQRILPVFRALFGPGRYFDVRVDGWDRVPDEPVMFVMNHSGGTIVLDCFGLMTAWYDREGFERPVHGLAHEVVFSSHATGRFFARGGMLRASREAARTCLADHGHSVLVCPGGDRDVWRPASRRFDVTFAGRTGYARTAAELGVPIVPIAHAGAHHTLHVLSDGSRFAKAVGIDRIARAQIFPVHLSFPWGLAVGPWPHLPPPTTFDYVVGEAIHPNGSDDLDIATLDLQVRSQLQGMLHDLRDRRARRPRVRHAVRRAREGARALRDLVDVVRELDDVPEALPVAAK